MTRIIIIGLFVFTKITLLAQETDSILYWAEETPLTWNDFKGSNDKDTYLFAQSSLKIKTEGVWKGDLPLFKVICCFNKKKSWTIDTISDSLLRHEQLHFDVSEIFARKMRMELGELRKKGEEKLNPYYDVINRILKDNITRQEQYDEETDHGILVEEQEKWNKKVKQELEELEEYKVDYSEYLKED